jgi:succinate dehydrogenase / fumarate reductase cytochrome b subunit
MSSLPGAEERRARGPVRHKGTGPRVGAWLDPRGHRLEGRAFTLQRVTGLALVLYLYVHLGVLSLLLGGRGSWNSFLDIATSVAFLGFDVLLMLLILFHALNGLRVGLVGSGFLARHERALFWAATAVGTLALAYGALHVLGSA